MGELSERLAEVSNALSEAGHHPGIVSGGSSPTLWQSHEVEGMTEVRAGTAIFFDREQVAIGSAREEDLAYSVLATVVSVAVPGQAVVDAGSKALAKEGRGGKGDFGVGWGRPEIIVKGLSEEHGVLDLSETDWRPRIGDRVRVVPNHVCVSVNLQDRLMMIDETGVHPWVLDARGRRPFRGSDAHAGAGV